MKISIITCSWNSNKYIDQSINSVLKQHFKNIEYIFVDGGSTDGTLERIASIPCEVKVLNDVRGGIAHAMNAGIKAATGDIIAHLHSDDYYLSEDVLSRVAAHFEQSDLAWLFGRVMFDDAGRLTPEQFVAPKYSYKRILMRNFIPHPATFIRREVFETCGMFSESLRYAMDYEFWLRVGRHYEPIQVDEPLAAFRRHEGSATQANFMRSFNEDFRVRVNHAGWFQIPEIFLRYFVRRYRLHSSGIK